MNESTVGTEHQDLTWGILGILGRLVVQQNGSKQGGQSFLSFQGTLAEFQRLCPITFSRKTGHQAEKSRSPKPEEVGGWTPVVTWWMFRLAALSAIIGVLMRSTVR